MTKLHEQPVLWHPNAPPKPPVGAPCNGCGLCCLAEPCPLGIWISRQRTGQCRALLWCDHPASANHHGRYVCGMLSDPARITGWHNPWILRSIQYLARRWIAAGIGCDADMHIQQLPDTTSPNDHRSSSSR